MSAKIAVFTALLVGSSTTAVDTMAAVGGRNSRHIDGVQGINFIVPSFAIMRQRDLEQEEAPTIFEAACDGQTYAGYGVEEEPFKNFVQHVAPGCQGGVSSRKGDFSPETTKYLHSMWKARRLLTSGKVPGAPPPAHAYTNRSSFFEEELVRTSHSVEKVMNTVESDGGKHFTLRRLEEALGDDVMKLNHPSKDAVQEVLTRMKKEFTFFHGDKCLVKSHNGAPCGEKAHLTGSSACNQDEATHDCTYTELYSCSECGASFRFPRYRSVPKILETKLGRCGEFSDVAMSVFDLLGYDTKLVVDHTDHVWVEVGVEGRGEKNTFLHADPSEGVLDNPYMYEDGWGKQLTFVLAHTSDSVEDRTDAYWHPDKHSEVVERRGMDDDHLNRAVFDANRDLENDWERRSLEERDNIRTELEEKDDLEGDGMEAPKLTKNEADLSQIVNELDVVVSKHQYHRHATDEIESHHKKHQKKAKQSMDHEEESHIRNKPDKKSAHAHAKPLNPAPTSGTHHKSHQLPETNVPVLTKHRAHKAHEEHTTSRPAKSHKVAEHAQKKEKSHEAKKHAGSQLEEDRPLAPVAKKKSHQAKKQTASQLEEDRPLASVAKKKSREAKKHAGSQLEEGRPLAPVAKKKSHEAKKHTASQLEEDRPLASAAKKKSHEATKHVASQLEVGRPLVSAAEASLKHHKKVQHNELANIVKAANLTHKFHQALEEIEQASHSTRAHLTPKRAAKQ